MKKKIINILVAGIFLLLALSPVISSVSTKNSTGEDEDCLKNAMEPFFKTYSDYYQDVYTQLEFKKYSPEIYENKPNVVFYDPEYVIVKLTEFGQTVKIFAETGLWPVDNIPELNSLLYFLNNGMTVDEFIALVEPLTDVEWAECNTLWDTNWIPNDPLFNQQWALDMIDCPQAWDKIKGSDSINLAIIDSGIDYNHPDLKNVIKGPDYVNHDDDPMDDYGHGTHCAGIAGATMNNGIGIAGVADVTLMAVKVMDSEGWGKTWGIAKGMIWATLNEAWVISMSLGSYYPSLLLDLACVYSVAEGPLKNPTVVVAAAGNEGLSNPCFPARFKTVISVGAVGQNYQQTSFTNKAFIYAPGDEILSTFPGNQYKKYSGTSMACPHVAGVAALICLQHNTRNFIKVKVILDLTAKNDVVNAALAVSKTRNAHYFNMLRAGFLFKLFSILIEKYVNLDNRM